MGLQQITTNAPETLPSFKDVVVEQLSLDRIKHDSDLNMTKDEIVGALIGSTVADNGVVIGTMLKCVGMTEPTAHMGVIANKEEWDEILGFLGSLSLNFKPDTPSDTLEGSTISGVFSRFEMGTAGPFHISKMYIDNIETWYDDLVNDKTDKFVGAHVLKHDTFEHCLVAYVAFAMTGRNLQ